MSAHNTEHAPLIAVIRDELRERRAARRERRALEAELATYTTAAELDDLSAVLERHTDAEAAEIRRILDRKRTYAA